MALFIDPTSLVFFDIPLFLFLFGVIFVLVRTFVKTADPVMNTAIAGLASGAAFILIRSQWKIQQALWFKPELLWVAIILIFVLIVVKWILHL